MKDDMRGLPAPAPGSLPASVPPREMPREYRDFTEDEDDFSLLRIAQILWRRKVFIIAVALVLIVAALLVVSQLTPRYTAEVLLQFAPPQTTFVQMDAVVGESADGASRSIDQAIQTEIEILKSRDLAEIVIERLDLIQAWEERAAAARERSWSRVLGEWALSVVALLPADMADLVNTYIVGEVEDVLPEGGTGAMLEEDHPMILADAVSRFDSSLRVSRAGMSTVLEVSFTDADPGLAASAANALAAAYLDMQLAAKTLATRRAEAWLTDQVEELREIVRTSRDQAEIYRERFGLVEESDLVILKQGLDQVNGELLVARETLSKERERIAFFQSLLKAQDIEALILNMPTPIVEVLFQRAAELKIEKAKIDALYSFDHPTLAAIAKETAEIRKFLLQEATTYLETLKKNLAVDQQRVVRLEQEIEALKTQINELGKAKVELRALESEADANQAMFETFLTRAKEARLQSEIQEADARIVSQAVTPGKPSWPNKTRMLSISALLSIIAACGLALLLENLQKGYRALEDLERDTGLPGLGIIPNVKAFGGRSTAADFVLERPNSAYSESIRTAHTGVLLSNVDTPARSILVTSSAPGEGKTTFAIGLARLLARGGSRVLLIDADLRRSQLHKTFDAPKGPGLVEVLLDGAHWREAVQTDEPSGLWFLTAGDVKVPSPQDVLGSERMGNLIFEASQELDAVIVDTPPAMAVSDASVVLQHVDRAVYLVRWGETPRDMVAQGLKQLRAGRAKVAGVVLSMVDLRKNARYGYSGSAYYYYGKHSKYYSS